MAAHAGTDIYIGFNDSAAPTTAGQNDFVIDVGSFASLQSDATGNGGTVDLMSGNSGLNQISASTFASTFSTAYGSDSGALNNVTVGAVGALGSTLWQTAPVGVTPAAITTGDFGNAVGQPANLVAGEYASTETTGFTYLVAENATIPGAEGSASVAAATGTNPMGQLANGDVVVQLWQVQETTGLHKSVGNWAEEGYFTIDLTSSGTGDDITYTVGPFGVVPEPATYGVMAGGLLLALALGRRFMPMLKRANQ